MMRGKRYVDSMTFPAGDRWSPERLQELADLITAVPEGQTVVVSVYAWPGAEDDREE